MVFCTLASFPRSRPTRTSVPYLASSSAVLRPMPDVGPVLLHLLRGERALLGQGPRLSLRPLRRRPRTEQEALAGVVAALVTGVDDHRVVAGAREGVSGVLLLARGPVVEPPAVVHLALGVLCRGREVRVERRRSRQKPGKVDRHRAVFRFELEGSGEGAGELRVIAAFGG